MKEWNKWYEWKNIDTGGKKCFGAGMKTELKLKLVINMETTLVYAQVKKKTMKVKKFLENSCNLLVSE